MSDLQCAATLLLVPAGQARAVTASLAGARVAHVWTGRAATSLRAAELVATDLGVGLTARPDLDDPENLDAALVEIADDHRGETVVVVSSGDEALEVLIDGDGMVSRPLGLPRRSGCRSANR